VWNPFSFDFQGIWNFRSQLPEKPKATKSMDVESPVKEMNSKFHLFPGKSFSAMEKAFACSNHVASRSSAANNFSIKNNNSIIFATALNMDDYIAEWRRH
jgi:hypothetical protein